MNKELNFKEVPQWWAICLDKTCPLSGNCLRHQGRQLQTGPRPGLNGPASGPRSPGLGLNMRRLATHYTPMPLSNLLVFNRLQLSGISVITYCRILPESAQSRSSPSGSPRLRNLNYYNNQHSLVSVCACFFFDARMQECKKYRVLFGSLEENT